MLDELERAINAWHFADTDKELHEWLGLSWEQYSAFIAYGALPDAYTPPWRCETVLA